MSRDVEAGIDGVPDRARLGQVADEKNVAFRNGVAQRLDDAFLGRTPAASSTVSHLSSVALPPAGV
jgi:hypothetical protein